jgi:hypothetical protein
LQQTHFLIQQMCLLYQHRVLFLVRLMFKRRLSSMEDFGPTERTVVTSANQMLVMKNYKKGWREIKKGDGFAFWRGFFWARIERHARSSRSHGKEFENRFKSSRFARPLSQAGGRRPGGGGLGPLAQIRKVRFGSGLESEFAARTLELCGVPQASNGSSKQKSPAAPACAGEIGAGQCADDSSACESLEEGSSSEMSDAESDRASDASVGQGAMR